MVRKEISKSKLKLFKLLLIAIAFVSASLWMIISGGAGNRYGEISTKFWGFAGITFFGVCLVLILWKFFDTKPGLIIDGKGITDNSSLVSVGFIPWNDILGIYECTVSEQKFLTIFVKDPDKYLMCKSIIKRTMLKMNMKMCGTPITISASGLKCDLDDLERILKSSFNSKKLSR